MSKKQATLLKIAGLCGIIGPLIALSFTAMAISHSLSWFSWTDNALSDLAGPHATITSASIFNSGLITCGLLGITFAVGLMQTLRKRTPALIGVIVLILADISLVAIGVFPETAGRIHFYVSVAFFTLFPISLLLIGASMAMNPHQRTLGLQTIMLAVFAVASVAPLVLADVADVGMHELLASLSGSAWSILLGIKLYKQTILS